MIVSLMVVARTWSFKNIKTTPWCFWHLGVTTPVFRY